MRKMQNPVQGRLGGGAAWGQTPPTPIFSIPHGFRLAKAVCAGARRERVGGDLDENILLR